MIGRRQGNLKYYSLNNDFLIYNELKSIFLKTRGAVAVIKDALSGESDIDFVFIYGSFAIGSEKETSDVDVMVIGNILLENLLKILREPETTLARDVNPSLCEPGEVKKRYSEDDPFITDVINSMKIILIGKEDELRRTLQ